MFFCNPVLDDRRASAIVTGDSDQAELIDIHLLERRDGPSLRRHTSFSASSSFFVFRAGSVSMKGLKGSDFPVASYS